jgi:large subunit ribosomal protein L21
MTYVIIKLGGKQYKVREGERVLVDRVPEDEGATFEPRVLMVGGEGDARLSPDDVVVRARVVGHVLGEKIRIGKYKPKSGYRRHTGFRARLSRVEIEAIRSQRERRGAPAAAEKKAAAEPAAAEGAPPPAAATPEGLPPGYSDMTVGQVTEGAKAWDRDALAAALAYEQAHAARKGALAALEVALAKEEG